MKTLADALVLAVNCLQETCKANDDDASCDLFYIGKILREVPDADLDQLAAAAKRALDEELAKGAKANPKWVTMCRYWMEEIVDAECLHPPVWDGNDRIDPVAYAIARYEQAKDQNGEMDMVLPHAADDRVFELLLASVRNPKADPMARTKAMRHFQHARPAKATDQQRLIDALLAVLAVRGDPRSTNDQLLRQYAALALNLYADRKEVEAVLFPHLMDRSEDGDVRSAVFQTLCGVGDSPARAEQFRPLLEDDFLRPQVETYFSLRRSRSQKELKDEDQFADKLPKDDV
jgi:hypothetical protein